MSKEPELQKASFVCPHCGIFANQNWIDNSSLKYDFHKIYEDEYYRLRKRDYSKSHNIESFLNLVKSTHTYKQSDMLPKYLFISICSSCNNYSLWDAENMTYPHIMIVDPPNTDMNQDIQDLYNEASSILKNSPKGAAALLRLALQKLLIQLGEKGDNINSDIASLVEKGLNVKIQQALDYIRVVGNEAVHPGTISLEDNQDIAKSLFKCINIIAKEKLTEPREVNEIYNDIIPKSKREAIAIRDKKN